MRLSCLIPVFGVAACFPTRPAFVEPKWGNAPTPLAIEVAEITQEYRHCTDKCHYDRVVLRRDGFASRLFKSGKDSDSLLVAPLDSAAFVRLAETLRRHHFFAHSLDSDGIHEPLSTESYVISAATLCRRQIITVAGFALDGPGGYQEVRSAIDSTVRALVWKRPRID